MNFRYVIGQSSGLGGLDEITFDGDVTWPYQQIGRTQAQDALNGKTQGIMEAIDEWLADAELQKAYPKVGDHLKARNAYEAKQRDNSISDLLSEWAQDAVTTLSEYTD